MAVAATAREARVAAGAGVMAQAARATAAAVAVAAAEKVAVVGAADKKSALPVGTRVAAAKAARAVAQREAEARVRAVAAMRAAWGAAVVVQTAGRGTTVARLHYTPQRGSSFPWCSSLEWRSALGMPELTRGRITEHVPSACR